MARVGIELRDRLKNMVGKMWLFRQHESKLFHWKNTLIVCTLSTSEIRTMIDVIQQKTILFIYSANAGEHSDNARIGIQSHRIKGKVVEKLYL